MKNICKNLIALSVMMVAAAFTSSAQSTILTKETSTVQSVPAVFFFNVQALDDLKNKIDVAYSNYKDASAEKDRTSEAHLEYLKAKRLYTVELEKQMSSYSKESVIGQKLRSELKRISAAD